MFEIPEITVAERERVESLVTQHGESRTAKSLNLQVTTVLRIIAGSTIRRGSILVLRDALATLDANTKR